MGHDLLKLRRDLENFEDASARWKPGLEHATACYALEFVVAQGIALFDLITRADETWRSAVLDGRVEYTKENDDSFAQAYEDWLRLCDEILPDIARAEREGFVLEKAEDLRSRVREAKGILTADEKFFVDDKFVALRDQAIDEHRAGKTDEYGPAERPNGNV